MFKIAAPPAPGVGAGAEGDEAWVRSSPAGTGRHFRGRLAEIGGVGDAALPTGADW